MAHYKQVLLVNLGTPDAPETSALRRYLAEFLWDKRVVDLPRPLWWLILNVIILRVRPARSAAAYRTIWTDQGSPLMVYTRSLAEKLDKVFEKKGIRVRYAMRYGNPSMASVLEDMRADGMGEVLVIPMYPQYSCATSASTFDKLAEVFRDWRELPKFHFLREYWLEPGYLDALAESVRAHRENLQDADKRLLVFSFHGVPKRYADEGDPYRQQCECTAREVAARLGLDASQWQLVFQSRFGREEWLQPYADKTLEALPTKGIKAVDVICPGFSCDCLETVEEMAEENREVFLEAGGEDYRYIPCLNDGEAQLALYQTLIEKSFN